MKPQAEMYEGMIVGIHTRNHDLVVNIIREKQLTKEIIQCHNTTN